MVECRTPEREVRGSRPTAAVLCPWARHFTPRKHWLITQEAMAPSRYDWKIVDWDVKPQHNQPTNLLNLKTFYWKVIWMLSWQPYYWSSWYPQNSGVDIETKLYGSKLHVTIMILSFRTDMPGQTVQTQIRLLGLHCLPFHLHRLDSLLYGRAT